VNSYPTIKFFPKGNDTPEDYSGARSETAFIDYINEKAGTHRTVGGGLDAAAGTIAALDEIVQKYVSGTSLKDAAAEIQKAAKDVKEGTQVKYAEYYVKVFDKLSSNDGYAAKELARLDSILKKGGLAPAKIDEFTHKKNVLSRFVEKVTGKEEL
jgi:protein disulfide-isomerase A6